MPGISDPGHQVIAAALAAGVPVHPLPGPCAAVTALVGSGLPTERFLFVGFLPPKSGGWNRPAVRRRHVGYGSKGVLQLLCLRVLQCDRLLLHPVREPARHQYLAVRRRRHHMHTGQGAAAAGGVRASPPCPRSLPALRNAALQCSHG